MRSAGFRVTQAMLDVNPRACATTDVGNGEVGVGKRLHGFASWVWLRLQCSGFSKNYFVTPLRKEREFCEKDARVRWLVATGLSWNFVFQEQVEALTKKKKKPTCPSTRV